MTAAIAGAVEAFSCLLEHFKKKGGLAQELQKCDKEGWPLMSYIARGGSVAIVQQLQKYECDFAKPELLELIPNLYAKTMEKFKNSLPGADRQNYTPLMMAAEDGAEEIFFYLLKHFEQREILTQQLNWCTQSGKTLLHAATGSDNVAIIRELRQQGGNFNVHSSDQWDPIELSIARGCLETTVELMKYGVSLYSRNKYESFLEKYEKEVSATSPIRKLLSNHYALFDLIAAHRFEQAQKLLQSMGSELYPNVRNRDGDTLLHLLSVADYAYSEQVIQLIKVLLEKGADKQIKNDAQKRPIDLAREQNSLLFVQELTSPWERGFSRILFEEKGMPSLLKRVLQGKSDFKDAIRSCLNDVDTLCRSNSDLFDNEFKKKLKNLLEGSQSDDELSKKFSIDLMGDDLTDVEIKRLTHLISNVNKVIKHHKAQRVSSINDAANHTIWSQKEEDDQKVVSFAKLDCSN